MAGRPTKQQQQVNTSLGLLSFTMSDLFKAIENRPTVYHFSLDDADDGKVRMRRHAKWIEIAEELFPQFNELPESEQQNLILRKLRMTWKGHIRSFLKTIRMKDAGDPRFKPYTFSKEMEFYYKFKHRNSIIKCFTNDEESDRYDDQQQKPEEKSPQKRKMINIVKNKLMNESITEENKSSKKKTASTVQETERSDAKASTPYCSERLRQRNSDNNDSYMKKLTPKSKKRLTLPNLNSSEENTRRTILDPSKGEIEQYESPHQDIPSELQLHANIGGDRNISETCSSNIRGIRQTSIVNSKINHEEITYHNGPTKNDDLSESPRRQPLLNYAPDSGTQELSTSDSRFCSTHSVPPVIDDEADLAFLESIKPSLRRINESQKLDFKIEFLQLLRKYQSNNKN